jgi:hypothetical protein
MELGLEDGVQEEETQHVLLNASAAAIGVIRSDTQLGLGTAVKSPPKGRSSGTRGPTKPPASWITEQRGISTQRGLPVPSDDILKRRFSQISVEVRRNIVSEAQLTLQNKRIHGNMASEKLKKIAKTHGFGQSSASRVDVLMAVASGTSREHLRRTASEQAYEAGNFETLNDGEELLAGRERGVRVAFPFDLGEQVEIFMEGEVTRVEGSVYFVSFIDGTCEQYEKGEIYDGVHAYKNRSKTPPEKYIGTREASDRVWSSVLPSSSIDERPGSWIVGT